ncbi:hypothetical protein NIES37_43110 [Tolypothrix tenuis PCC 7101]|uniref:Uncharacterized protein n=1 Tax=Tolypothrix tenuis PCC 7101 TaxID=231146 RepID=A0A1Z4N3U3_9CYAN|nr:hypothetical protein NIES37_43110 [Tolypothrix tenuis PCC 7101]BAZ75757.1 hypothetical protein NIES50_43480 [Aulosira laxa NIES-50]
MYQIFFTLTDSTCVYTVAPGGRGAGGEGETLQPSGFHIKLTPMENAHLCQLKLKAI